MKALKAKREKDLARRGAENVRLSSKVEELSRKLEKMGSEQRGDEAEVDLFVLLKAEFPRDRIERVGKGRRGADVIQHVFSGQQEIGRIVYESKNVSTWQNAFITKAKQYQRRYDTPYVLLVSRAFPKKKNGLCVVKEIPVVEPRLAIPLARVIRDAIEEIGRLQLSHEGSRAKAQKLFEYIVGNEFRSRFQAIADSVKELKGHQDKERDWHENAWQKQSKLYEQIDACRREVSAKVKATTGGAEKKQKLAVVHKSA